MALPLRWLSAGVLSVLNWDRSRSKFRFKVQRGDLYERTFGQGLS